MAGEQGAGARIEREGRTMSIPVDQFTLLDKHALAQRLGMSPGGILKLVATRQIPAIKLGHRTLRFSWPAVEKALAKLTILEVTR